MTQTVALSISSILNYGVILTASQTALFHLLAYSVYLREHFIEDWKTFLQTIWHFYTCCMDPWSNHHPAPDCGQVAFYYLLLMLLVLVVFFCKLY